MDRLRELLREDFDITAAVHDGQAAVDAASEHHPDAVIFDINVPVLDGLEAARQILQSLPDAKVVFVSNHHHPAIVREALALGASGYVLKTFAAEELLPAIRTALSGGTHVSPIIELPGTISPSTP